jgi:hypothetical protein
MATDNFVELTYPELELYFEEKKVGASKRVFVKGTNVEVSLGKDGLKIQTFDDLAKAFSTYQSVKEVRLEIPEGNYIVDGVPNKPQSISLTEARYVGKDGVFSKDIFTPDDLLEIGNTEKIVIDSRATSDIWNKSNSMRGTTKDIPTNVQIKTATIKSILDNFGYTRADVEKLYATNPSASVLDKENIKEFFDTLENPKGVTPARIKQIAVWSSLRSSKEINPVDFYFRMFGGYIIEDVMLDSFNKELIKEGYKLQYNNKETIVNKSGKVTKKVFDGDKPISKSDFELVKINADGSTSKLQPPIYVDAKSILTADNAKELARGDYSLFYGAEDKIKETYLFDDVKAADNAKKKIQDLNLTGANVQQRKNGFITIINSALENGVITGANIDKLNEVIGEPIFERSTRTATVMQLVAQSSNSKGYPTLNLLNNETIKDNVKGYDAKNSCNNVLLNEKTGGSVQSLAANLIAAANKGAK